jgi:diguanylate cyclase (GGDEF)-like protein
MFPLAYTRLRSHQVVRYAARQTLIGICFVIPSTVLAICWICGWDFDRPLSGRAVLWFGTILAFAETIVFTPLISFRSILAFSQLNRVQEKLSQLANTDSLTGLLNRRGFGEVASTLLSTPMALGRPVSALICDIDFFKKVNDEFGHEFGDAALRRVADVLRASAGEASVALGRQGGEEFVVLLMGFAHADAFAFAESLREAFVARPIEWNGMAAAITVSIGLASTVERQVQLFLLLARADAALYEAKRNGRNRVAVSNDELLEAA